MVGRAYMVSGFRFMRTAMFGLLLLTAAIAEARAQELTFSQIEPTIIPVDFLPAESVERLDVVGSDTIVVTRQSVFKTRVLQSVDGMWKELFRYGKTDSNIIFSGHQRTVDGVLRLTCLTRNSMLTAAHGTYAELLVDLDGGAELKIQQDTFQTILTGSSSVTASARGHVLCARQRGGAQLPEPGSHLLYQFDTTGLQRSVGVINAGVPDVLDGGFSIACFTDGTSLVTGISAFPSTSFSKAWVVPFDRDLKQHPTTTFITNGSERVLATLIESQPQHDTVLSFTVLRSADADTSIVLSFIDRSGAVVRSRRLDMSTGSAFYPIVIRRHSDTWTAAGYLQVKIGDESVIYAAFVRISIEGDRIFCSGFVNLKTTISSFVSYWTDPSGREYLGGYSRAGMMFYPINETISSVQEPSSTPIHTVHISRLLWGQEGGPTGNVQVFDLQGRLLGVASSAGELLAICAQRSYVWVVSADRSWLVATQ